MRDVNKIRLDRLRLRPGGRVLDVGCGRGVQAAMLAQAGLVVYGIERSAALIRDFRAATGAFYPVVGDAARLPLGDARFTAVIATEVLEHVDEPAALLREAHRVLEPGGMACFAVPTASSERLFQRLHPTWQRDSGHVHVFSTTSLRQLLTATGFTIHRVENQNFEWTCFWLVHSLLRSRFDCTGTPIENARVSGWILRGWHWLDRLRLGASLRWCGNRVLPKSVYVYAQKVPPA